MTRRWLAMVRVDVVRGRPRAGLMLMVSAGRARGSPQTCLAKLL